MWGIKINAIIHFIEIQMIHKYWYVGRICAVYTFDCIPKNQRMAQRHARSYIYLHTYE